MKTGKALQHQELCLLLLLAFLPACLTVEQNIALRLDGSASVRLSYQVPAALTTNPKGLEDMHKRLGFALPLTENDARDFFKGNPGVEVEGFTSTTEKGLYWAVVTLSCTNIERLSHGPLSYSLRDLGGVKVFSITAASTGFRPPQPQKTPGKPSVGQILETAMAVSQRGLILKVMTTFPTRVLSSNGTISGRSVTWVVPLLSGATLEAKFRAFPSLWDRIRGWLGFTP